MSFSIIISPVFVETEVQNCMVHQIRNSLRYVASKDQKIFMRDLKPVYQAINIAEAHTVYFTLPFSALKKMVA